MTDDTQTGGYQPTDRLTRKQAAAVLGLKVGMIDHLRRAGKLSYEKNTLTGAIRFVYAELLALKIQRESPGRAVPANAGHYVIGATTRGNR